jgi:hypothetical protein
MPEIKLHLTAPFRLIGPDGAAFSPTHTRKGGRLYRYYVSQTVLKHGARLCPMRHLMIGLSSTRIPHRIPIPQESIA